jgi:hypothetical protein
VTTKTAAIIAVAILAAGALVATAIVFTNSGAGDGAEDDAPRAISRDAWQEKVLAAGARRTADWDMLESGIADDCTKSADDWALYLSLNQYGVSPDIPRAGLEYKCPERVAVFDEGQAQHRDTASKVDELCNAPYDALSPEDQEWVDAVCVP